VSTLLADRYAPITSEIGFLQCGAGAVAKAFIDWQSPIQEKRGVALCVDELRGTLDSVLPNLLPLTSVERRRTLFVPTVGNWTAYFDNGWRGADAYSGVSYLSELLGCKGVRAAYVPHYLDEQDGRQPGRYGSVLLELFAATKTDFVNTERSIAVAFDGKKWVFAASGVPQEFEDIAQYSSRSVKDRFTPEMLSKYLECLGIRAFDYEFYDPSASSFLIRREGAIAPGLKEYSLEQARAELGLKDLL
jgi:hypothetical protein